MSKNFTIYLNDIREAINSIEIFVEGMTFEEFKNDDKTSSAVIRKFEIIGEATKNLPEDMKNQHSQIKPNITISRLGSFNKKKWFLI